MFSVGEKVSFIEAAFGPTTLSRDMRNIAIVCPICNPADKTKRKLVIRISDDANHCWVCGWKARTLAPLLRKYSKNRLEEYCKKFNPNIPVANQGAALEPNAPLALPNGFRLLTTAPVADVAARAAMRYLRGRGLTFSDLWRYKIGIADDPEYRDRVIVPSFDRTGALNYFTCRSMRNAKPKYKNSDVPRTDVIFDELSVDWTTRVVVCEGVFDMIACGDNAVPVLGSELSEAHALFNAIVMNGTPVCIALDSDMVDKSHGLAQKLAEYDIDVSVADLRGHHDPGSMTKDEIDVAIANATPWGWDMKFYRKLSKAADVRLRG